MLPGTERLLFQAAEWTFLLSGALTTAYVLKLLVVLFVEKPAPGLHEKSVYISPLNAAILAVSAAALPLLGCLPYHLADPIAYAGASFMHGPAAHHVVNYFSPECLEGAGISLGIGALLYLLPVRALLTKKDAGNTRLCLNLWPAGLDLEERLFRPLIAGTLPAAGAFLAKGVDRTADAVIHVLPFLGALAARVIDLTSAGPVTLALSHAARIRFIHVPEDPDFGIYREEDNTPALRTLLPSSMAYSLISFAVGLLFLLAWLIHF